MDTKASNIGPSGLTGNKLSMNSVTNRASAAVMANAAGTPAGARFVGLESGGHLMLGQAKTIRAELADFFADKERSQRGPRGIQSTEA